MDAFDWIEMRWIRIEYRWLHVKMLIRSALHRWHRKTDTRCLHCWESIFDRVAYQDRLSGDRGRV